MNRLNQTELIDRILCSFNQDHNQTQTARLISAFNYGQKYENELLFFFKPECFFSGKHRQTLDLLEMVMEKFRDYNIQITGAMLLRGHFVDNFSIMDKHYGYINHLSRESGSILKSGEKAEIHRMLELDSPDDFEILGGHEFLNRFDTFDAFSLNKLWSSKKSLKLRSGFYFQSYRVEDPGGDNNISNVILVNGFHPAQLRHFTEPERKIVVLLLNSDSDWNDLKFKLVGDTFPEKAEPQSIRGELFNTPGQYGLDSVSVSSNCVHLSAGPFEALFEIQNFLSNVKDTGFQMKCSNIYRLMTEAGFKPPAVTHCLENPGAIIDNETVDLFTFTENKNSEEAICDFRDLFYKEDAKPYADSDG